MKESFGNEPFVRALEDNERDGIILEAAKCIGAQMNKGAFSALASEKDILRLRRENSSVDKVFGNIMALTGRDDLGPVHPWEDFSVIDEAYRGADGKVRHPLPKYIPTHVTTRFAEMQKAYRVWMDEGLYFGEYVRPGLIVQSAYRSPYYQLGVMARTMAERGVRKTLSSVALPGVSQHADYEACAIDINNIGDRYGKTKRDDGSTVDFSETMEFDWLIKNAARFGFWFSYFPNKDRIFGVGKDGIIVEPWHIQFHEDAASKMSESHAESLFRMWKDKMVSDRELKLTQTRYW